MWLAHEQYERIWQERQQDMQREAAQWRLVKLALAGRRKPKRTPLLPRYVAGVWRNVANMQPKPTVEPCCVPVE